MSHNGTSFQQAVKPRTTMQAVNMERQAAMSTSPRSSSPRFGQQPLFPQTQQEQAMQRSMSASPNQKLVGDRRVSSALQAGILSNMDDNRHPSPTKRASFDPQLEHEASIQGRYPSPTKRKTTFVNPLSFDITAPPPQQDVAFSRKSVMQQQGQPMSLRESMMNIPPSQPVSPRKSMVQQQLLQQPAISPRKSMFQQPLSPRKSTPGAELQGNAAGGSVSMYPQEHSTPSSQPENLPESSSYGNQRFMSIAPAVQMRHDEEDDYDDDNQGQQQVLQQPTIPSRKSMFQQPLSPRESMPGVGLQGNAARSLSMYQQEHSAPSLQQENLPSSSFSVNQRSMSIAPAVQMQHDEEDDYDDDNHRQQQVLQQPILPSRKSMFQQPLSPRESMPGVGLQGNAARSLSMYQQEHSAPSLQQENLPSSSFSVNQRSISIAPAVQMQHDEEDDYDDDNHRQQQVLQQPTIPSRKSMFQQPLSPRESMPGAGLQGNAARSLSMYLQEQPAPSLQQENLPSSSFSVNQRSMSIAPAVQMRHDEEDDYDGDNQGQQQVLQQPTIPSRKSMFQQPLSPRESMPGVGLQGNAARSLSMYQQEHSAPSLQQENLPSSSFSVNQRSISIEPAVQMQHDEEDDYDDDNHRQQQVLQQPTIPSRKSMFQQPLSPRESMPGAGLQGNAARSLSMYLQEQPASSLQQENLPSSSFSVNQRSMSIAPAVQMRHDEEDDYDGDNQGQQQVLQQPTIPSRKSMFQQPLSPGESTPGAAGLQGNASRSLSMYQQEHSAPSFQQENLPSSSSVNQRSMSIAPAVQMGHDDEDNQGQQQVLQQPTISSRKSMFQQPLSPRKSTRLQPGTGLQGNAVRSVSMYQQEHSPRKSTLFQPGVGLQGNAARSVRMYQQEHSAPSSQPGNFPGSTSYVDQRSMSIAPAAQMEEDDNDDDNPGIDDGGGGYNSETMTVSRSTSMTPLATPTVQFQDNQSVLMPTTNHNQMVKRAATLARPEQVARANTHPHPRMSVSPRLMQTQQQLQQSAAPARLQSSICRSKSSSPSQTSLEQPRQSVISRSRSMSPTQMNVEQQRQPRLSSANLASAQGVRPGSPPQLNRYLSTAGPRVSVVTPSRASSIFQPPQLLSVPSAKRMQLDRTSLEHGASSSSSFGSVNREWHLPITDVVLRSMAAIASAVAFCVMITNTVWINNQTISYSNFAGFRCLLQDFLLCFRRGQLAGPDEDAEEH
ncbi:hypothetical protein L7F22_009167 [Adiantum nelumboides]|nr:hypothetical protein [Adiantum nelumboides]